MQFTVEVALAAHSCGTWTRPRAAGPIGAAEPGSCTSRTGAGMSEISFSAGYRTAMAQCGGRCPIEAGMLGKLADHECGHGRLPGDQTAACGCWPQEGAAVLAL